MALSIDDDASPAAVVDLESRIRRLSTVAVLAGCALVVAILYFTQQVLIPIALAILLSFLLSPVVRGFERIRFGRVGSVVVVTVLAFGLLGAVGFGLFTQVTRLAADLPGYRSNIRAKVVDVQGATSGGVIDKLRGLAEDVMDAIDRGAARRAAKRGLTPSSENEPVPVVMQAPSVLWQIPTLIEGFASAGLVLVLVIFMLLERRELRDRLIRLIGYGRLAVTTRAFDEAAARISRYLIAQSLLNAGFGLTVGAGLWALGVPYALLWGFLAAVLRFIPYVGPFLGAAMPVVLSLAAFSGWSIPLMVVGLFAVCELITNMIVEPLVYGQSAGVSQVALLVAIAFWTWLWGPIGLVLATPLTVCLVVLSKNVPELRFLFYLLADEEVLEPDVRLYQRLLAADDEEALEVVADYRTQNPECDPIDDLVLPVLVRTSVDRATQRLKADEELRMYRAARRLIATMREAAAAEALEAKEASEPQTASAPATARAEEEPRVHVLGCPATSKGDGVLLQMLQRKLEAAAIEVERTWPGMRSLELLATVETSRPRVVCISALPPRGALAARYLCRRLRKHFPELTIVVLAPDGIDEAAATPALIAAGANHVVDDLRSAHEAVLQALTPATTPATTLAMAEPSKAAV